MYSKVANDGDVHITFPDWIPLICSVVGMLVYVPPLQHHIHIRPLLMSFGIQDQLDREVEVDRRQLFVQR